MKNSYKIIFADRVVFYALIFSFFGILVQTIFSGIQFINMPPIIPLFNSLSWGQERLVNKIFIFSVPGFLLLTVLVNFFFVSQLYKKNPLLSRMLLFNVLLGVFLSGIATVQIFFLVF